MADPKTALGVNMAKVTGIGEPGKKATADLIKTLQGGGPLGSVAASAVKMADEKLPSLIANSAFLIQAGLLDKNGVVGEQRTQFNKDLAKIRAFSVQVAAQMNRLDSYPGDRLVYERTLPPYVYFRQVPIVGKKKTEVGLIPQVDAMGRIQVHFDGFEANRKAIESEMEKGDPVQVLHQKAYELVFLTLAPLLSEDLAKKLKEQLEKPGKSLDDKEVDPIMVLARNMYIGVYEKLERMFPPSAAAKYLDSLQDDLTPEVLEAIPEYYWQQGFETSYKEAADQVKNQQPTIQVNFPNQMRKLRNAADFPVDFNFDLADLVKNDYNKVSADLGFDKVGGLVDKPDKGPVQLFKKDIFPGILDKFIANNPDWANLSDQEQAGFRGYLLNFTYRLFLKYIDPQNLLRKKYLEVDKAEGGSTLEETQEQKQLMTDFQNRSARERAQANVFKKIDKMEEVSPENIQYSTPAFHKIALNIKKQLDKLNIKNGVAGNPSEIIVAWKDIREDLIKIKQISEANPNPKGVVADFYRDLSNLFFEEGYIEPAGGINNLQAQLDKNIGLLTQLVRDVIPRLVSSDAAQIQFMQSIMNEKNLLSKDVPAELNSLDGYKLLAQIQDANLTKDNPQQATVIDTVAAIFNIAPEILAKADPVQIPGQKRDYTQVNTVEEALNKALNKGLPNGNRAVYLAILRHRLQAKHWKEPNKNKPWTLDDLGKLMIVVGDGTEDQQKIARNIMTQLKDMPLATRKKIIDSLGAPFSDADLPENYTDENIPLDKYRTALIQKLSAEKKDVSPIVQLETFVPHTTPISKLHKQAGLKLMQLFANEPVEFRNRVMEQFGPELFTAAQDEIVSEFNIALIGIDQDMVRTLDSIEKNFPAYIKQIQTRNISINTRLTQFIDYVEAYEQAHPGALHPYDPNFDKNEYKLKKGVFYKLKLSVRIKNQRQTMKPLLGQLELKEFSEENKTLQRARMLVDTVKKWGTPTQRVINIDNTLINMQNTLDNFRSTTASDIRNSLMPVSQQLDAIQARLNAVQRDYGF